MSGQYINLGDTVRRAWKTDPKHQLQVGTIAEVYEVGCEEHDELGHDVEIIWSDGNKTKEMCCELVKCKSVHGIWQGDILSDVHRALDALVNLR